MRLGSRMEKGYDEKVMQISAYCSLQARLLELYNPKYDDEAMLKEIGPLSIRAIMDKRAKNLKYLEDLSRELSGRITEFEKRKPEIVKSQEAVKLIKLLEQREREYLELGRYSQNCF